MTTDADAADMRATFVRIRAETERLRRVAHALPTIVGTEEERALVCALADMAELLRVLMERK